MTDRKFADEIIVTATPDNRYSLTIDGEEFPWWIGPAGVTTTVSDNDVPSVTITILANSVQVHHKTQAPHE